MQLHLVTGTRGGEVSPPTVAGDVTVELTTMLRRLGELADGDLPAADADRIDRIAALEQIKAAATAAQAAEMVAFAQSQVEAQRHSLVDPRRLGRGIADQLALACKISPSAGSRRLSLARALCFDLPCTFTQLRAGQVSEWVVTLVARETSHLDGQTRRAVDAQLAARGLDSMSPRRASATARRLSYSADPIAALQRSRTEEWERRVSVRPAPDTMAILTAYLPAAQAIAAWAALRGDADRRTASGDTRTRGQIMADSLVERVTGQQSAGDVNLEIGLLIPIETLTDRHCPRSAELEGYGPIPAQLARELVSTTQGCTFLRRLFTAPSGQIVTGDQRRRRFAGPLARLIMARDQHCRDPYCEAPIRHIDHIRRFTDDGQTTYSNGRGVCARGNYVREMPGWQIKLTEDGLDGGAHTVTTTTPTGHTYVSRAPRPP